MVMKATWNLYLHKHPKDKMLRTFTTSASCLEASQGFRAPIMTGKSLFRSPYEKVKI